MKGRAILETVEGGRQGRDPGDRTGPYHLDPGLHHGIPDEFQVLGYPILSIKSIPKDEKYLKRFFSEDDGNPLDINDVWPENYSANSAQKRVGRQVRRASPERRAVLDLSSFKCGHDAPTYGIIDGIVERSARPALALHDLDANKPGGSIKIRVKTYAHSLSLYAGAPRRPHREEARAAPCGSTRSDWSCCA